jgi:hypothetical protein
LEIVRLFKPLLVCGLRNKPFSDRRRMHIFWTCPVSRHRGNVRAREENDCDDLAQVCMAICISHICRLVPGCFVTLSSIYPARMRTSQHSRYEHLTKCTHQCDPPCPGSSKYSTAICEVLEGINNSKIMGVVGVACQNLARKHTSARISGRGHS